MVRIQIQKVFKSFPSLVQSLLSFCEKIEICPLRAFDLYLGKYFLKNSCVILPYVPIDLGLNEYNQLFALSFKEKGKKFSLTIYIAPS